MRAQINFEPGMMNEAEAKMFGFLVTKGVQDGATITFSEVGTRHGVEHTVEYIDIESSAAYYGQGDSLTEALTNLLTNLDDQREVKP